MASRPSITTRQASGRTHSDAVADQRAAAADKQTSKTLEARRNVYKSLNNHPRSENQCSAVSLLNKAHKGGTSLGAENTKFDAADHP